MVDLQQSPALCPLMWKLTPFAQIAVRASDNKVRGIVTSTSAERHDMVNVMGIFAFAQFSKAVVALALLSLVLLFNLLWGMRSFGVLIPGSTVMPMYPPLFTMRLAVLLIILLVLFHMGTIVGESILKDRFAPGQISLMLMLFVIRTWMGQFTCFPGRIATRPTVRSEASFAICPWVEVFKRSGKRVFALRTAFLRYTIHGKGHSLSSQGMYQHHSGNTIFGELIIPQIGLPSNFRGYI